MVSNIWTKHLDKDQRDSFKEYLLNDSQILEALEAVLLRELDIVYDQMASEVDYSTDWSHLQAHRNGKLELLNKLQKLTEHLGQD